MKELIITPAQEDQRLDRLLQRYLSGASTGFLYKMIRKKNITVNDKKAEPAMHLKAGDSVKIWFSEETLAKFTQGADIPRAAQGDGAERYPYRALDIVYEDEHVLFVDKPAGMLSQRAGDSDISLCEYLIGYLLHEGSLTPDMLSLFSPSVCNRLDRNTSGLVACGKSVAGLQQLSALIRDREVRKFYRCIVVGCMDRPRRLDGYLQKDEKTNKVMVSAKAFEDARKITTAYRPLDTWVTDEGLTLTDLEVELVTGRTHQIRAHLSSIGHPIIGDPKYGSTQANRLIQRNVRLPYQLLHAWRMEIPQIPAGSMTALDGISGQVLSAPLPEYWEKIRGGKT